VWGEGGEGAFAAGMPAVAGTSTISSSPAAAYACSRALTVSRSPINPMRYAASRLQLVGVSANAA
jgi:hypothetical protein